MDVGSEEGGRGKGFKDLIQADELKRCDQERNIEFLLPRDSHSRFCLSMEERFLMNVRLKYFLEADRPGNVKKGKVWHCPSAEELCSGEEEEKFELNIFLVGTTCKRSV